MKNNSSYSSKRVCAAAWVVYFSFLFLILSSHSYCSDPGLHIGNDSRYLNCVGSVQKSPLKRKKILFLGSSVTRGRCSLGISFADILCRKWNFFMVKDAVDGTLLVKKGENSYISRLEKYTKDSNVDLLVVQLSTNDSLTNDPIEGERADTIGKAILFIVEYARNTLCCPVVFFTCPYFENEKYKKMCDYLRSIADNKGIRVVDIFRDGGFQSLSPFEFQLCMFDSVHPTLVGYIRWLPLFEEQFFRIFPRKEDK